jgi:TonB family protein
MNLGPNFSHGMRKLVPVVLQSALFALLLTVAMPAHAADRAVKVRVPPVYPEMAKRMKISGSVRVQVTIDASGAVTAVKALDGNRMLSQAAEDAVKKWKYEAGDGPVTTEVTLNFALAS